MSEHDFGDGNAYGTMHARNVDKMFVPVKMHGSAVQSDRVDRAACRIGDASGASAHASTLNRSALGYNSSVEGSLLRLQRQYGNHYVGQILSRTDAGEEQGEDNLNAVGRSIDKARGGGASLDHAVQGQMESSFGANFGGVRIHTDTHADSLNRALNARAFATGKDIFFRQGEYNPGTSVGRELLAHELTHVVQQNGNEINRQMTVSHPDAPEEVEAEQMARAVMQQEHQAILGTDHQAIKRQGIGKEIETKADDGALQRQPEAVKDEDEKGKRNTS
jgi:hypothetical protein